MRTCLHAKVQGQRSCSRFRRQSANKWSDGRTEATALSAALMRSVPISKGTCRAARVAGRPTPSARYACRPVTARPQVDPGCLRIRRAGQTGGVASNSAVGISNRRISPTGFNGAPHICPRNYPFPLTDLQTPLPASSLSPFDLPCQTASESDPPFSTMHWTDRHTHTDSDSWQMVNASGM